MNFISHGSRNLGAFVAAIALQGKVTTSGNVSWRDATPNNLADTESLDLPTVRQLAQVGDTVNQIRKALTADAEIFLYSCDSGLDADISKAPAGIFDRPVHAFADQTFFFPEFTPNPEKIT